MEIVHRKILRKIWEIVAIKYLFCQDKCRNYKLKLRRYKDRDKDSRFNFKEEEIIITQPLWELMERILKKYNKY